MNSANAAQTSLLVSQSTSPSESHPAAQSSTVGLLGGEISVIVLGAILVTIAGLQGFRKLVRSLANCANK